jgi:addiction module HigA family antidote
MLEIDMLSRMTFRPIGPGDFLRDVLCKANISQEKLAENMFTSRFTINQIVRGKRNVTPSMALKLSKALGTSVQVWLNLQRAVDLFDAFQESRSELEAIETIKLDPVVIHHLETTDSEVETLAGSKLSVAYPSFDNFEPARSQDKITVCVFSPDNLDWIERSFGIKEVGFFLDRFVEALNDFASAERLNVYHYNLETLALVAIGNMHNEAYYEALFSHLPTSLRGIRGEMKLTLSGGIATSRDEALIEDVADTAVDIMYEVRRFRSGEAIHRWSDKKID